MNLETLDTWVNQGWMEEEAKRGLLDFLDTLDPVDNKGPKELKETRV